MCVSHHHQAELNGLLREEITVERSTVWRDMMAMERRQVSAQVKSEMTSGSRPWWVQQRLEGVVGSGGCVLGNLIPWLFLARQPLTPASLQHPFLTPDP